MAHVENHFHSNERRAQQAERDRAEAARPVMVQGATLNLRSIDERLARRKREGHEHGVRASLAEVSCRCGRTALELLVRGERKRINRARRAGRRARGLR